MLLLKPGILYQAHLEIFSPILNSNMNLNSTLLTNMPSPTSLNKSILFLLLFVLCLVQFNCTVMFCAYWLYIGCFFCRYGPMRGPQGWGSVVGAHASHLLPRGHMVARDPVGGLGARRGSVVSWASHGPMDRYLLPLLSIIIYKFCI